jgi:hypothetical protein
LSESGDGVEVMQTYSWIALIEIVGGLVLSSWWYQHRRAWSTNKQDEAIRRHANRNYDLKPVVKRGHPYYRLAYGAAEIEITKVLLRGKSREMLLSRMIAFE